MQAVHGFWLLACLPLIGCTYEMQPMSNHPGTLTLSVPGSFPTVVRPRPAARDTSSAEQAISGPPPVSMPPAGRFEGTATVINNPGGRCSRTWRVTNWTVDGDRVRFGAFRGTIRPDGSLLMQAGSKYVKGSFAGPSFTGRLWRAGRACTYTLALRSVG